MNIICCPPKTIYINPPARRYFDDSRGPAHSILQLRPMPCGAAGPHLASPSPHSITPSRLERGTRTATLLAYNTYIRCIAYNIGVHDTPFYSRNQTHPRLSTPHSRTSLSPRLVQAGARDAKAGDSRARARSRLLATAVRSRARRRS